MDAYRLIFERMDTPAYLLNREGQLVTCNGQLLQFLGVDHQYDSIDTLFRQHGLWTALQIQQIQQEEETALISGHNDKKMHSMIHATGDILYFEFVYTPLFDDSGNGYGLLVEIHDVTEQKQMNTQLRSLEERLAYYLKSFNVPENAVVERVNREKIPKVLIVEDNRITQQAEAQLLKCCHCFTDIVATLAEVKNIFQPGKYDLALVDLGLGSGNGNGYQVTEVLRDMEKGGRFRVPIIALTGADLSTVACECDDSEMDGMINKPLTKEQSRQLIERYVHHADVQVTGLREFT